MKLGHNPRHIIAADRTNHTSPHRCCMGKPFTVPAEMFPHSWEPLCSKESFESAGMIQHHQEPFGEGYLLIVHRQGPPPQRRSRHLFSTEEPGTAERTPSDQHAMHRAGLNPANDVSHRVQ